MKKLTFILATVFFSLAIGCKDEPIPEEKKSIMPDKITVKIPESISSVDLQKSINALNIDTIKGAEIYKLMRVFIFLGASSAEVVEAIVKSIADIEITEPTQANYVAEDGRQKNLTVVANETYNDQTWDYFLDCFDGEDNAIQVFWNIEPLKGVVIMKPSIMNYDYTQNPDAMYKIEFGEDNEDYDNYMLISITGLDSTEQNYAKNLKMFVGKLGDIVTVYGNSFHPGVEMTSTGNGINWAFVAQADAVQNIGVAEICLPDALCTTSSNILNDYSIYNVLQNALTYAGVTDSTTISAYLFNATAPGYFGETGFVASGTENIPSTEFNILDISTMQPFAPIDVYNLSIEFFINN